MSRHTPALALAVVALLFSRSLGAQTLQAVPPPDSETISQLEQQVRNGYPLPSIGVGVTGVSLFSLLQVTGGLTDHFAVMTKSSSGQLTMNNFVLRNSRDDSVQVTIFQPSSRAFPIFFELAKRQQYAANLQSGVYYIGALSQDGVVYFRADIASSKPGLTSYLYSLRRNTDSFLEWTTIPETAVIAATTSDDDTIQDEIEKIRSASYTAMPLAKAVPASLHGAAAITIENGTSYMLSVLLSGPVSRKVDLAAGGAQDIILSPGNYEIAVSFSHPSVVPFYGKENFGSNMRYSKRFYITSK
ncbi:MAG: hypothetical protein A3G76_02585 [Acidobacteria bacterium RIFCSPLOWO2_12_FULL_65_11]|nr:MAG: hypothetical protein A3H95_14890 [Acidobacteria bacterium RIFCSPLOWO2_02_FULL_64_15]OFW34069.1 MAG: hypothetical protein A3G76_02585 [Acidobacteria bacterium RIFCSPLOWO2_12_FULL_65_11]